MMSSPGSSEGSSQPDGDEAPAYSREGRKHSESGSGAERKQEMEYV